MSRLRDLVVLVAKAGVDAIVAGGYAVTSHGSALVTYDVDVVCRMEVDNLLRLFDVLEPLHPFHRMTPEKLPFTREQAGKTDWKDFYLSTDWGQLVCLGEVKGLGDYEACRAVSEPIILEDVGIGVLTLDALITAKRAMGHPRDLHAVLELEAIRERQKEWPAKHAK